MKIFIGNTIVFLPDEVKIRIYAIQEQLHRECSDILAEPLIEDIFHITLHDLLNGEKYADLRWRMGEIQDRAKQLVWQIAERNEEIRLKSSVLFNMVNTSMVLGFEPADEESCQRIMEYYEILQEVVSLSYPLTPHVTVAYFKPSRIEIEQVKKLQGVIDWVNEQTPIRMILSTKMLKYQEFSNMNHYWNS